jgi:hypothetical protein
MIDNAINQYIDTELIRANKEREAKHEPSGKLSASILYQPIRWQLLKVLGAPRKEFDAYTLAKFKRGLDVEEWYVSQLKGAGVLIEDKETLEKMNLKVTDGQPFAEYKECIGYIDSVIDTGQMQAKVGIIPNEIKSITNMKWKQVARSGIDWHYKIQAGFYALAMGVEHFAVTIISSEDLRRETHIFRTREMMRDVENAISAYNKAMEVWNKNKVLPAFAASPNVAWTANLKYAMFEEQWADDDKWAIKELTTLGII